MMRFRVVILALVLLLVFPVAALADPRIPSPLNYGEFVGNACTAYGAGCAPLGWTWNLGYGSGWSYNGFQQWGAAYAYDSPPIVQQQYYSPPASAPPAEDFTPHYWMGEAWDYAKQDLARYGAAVTGALGAAAASELSIFSLISGSWARYNRRYDGGATWYP